MAYEACIYEKCMNSYHTKGLWAGTLALLCQLENASTDSLPPPSPVVGRDGAGRWSPSLNRRQPSARPHANGPFGFVLRCASAGSPVQARQSTARGAPVVDMAGCGHNHASSFPGLPLMALWTRSSFLCNKRKPRRVPIPCARQSQPQPRPLRVKFRWLY